MSGAFPKRELAWAWLDREQRLIVIGGGITGAGIFLLAARAGLRPLLLEAHDFASGTSSRSSKLVHGGLRYLRNGQFVTTWHSVQEREQLLQGSGGLVERLPFAFPVFKGEMPLWLLGLGLTLFDLIAMKWQHHRLSPQATLARLPSLREAGLQGAYLYHDALTDDARLVLRVIQEGLRAGGTALNYAPVTELVRSPAGRLRGLKVMDGMDATRDELELEAPVVISATGAWADELRRQVGRRGRLRPLRGSHLVFAHDRFPLPVAVTVLHPDDQRPLFAIPWEGVTIFGTTDTDLGGPVRTDLRMTAQERDYLFTALEHGFPALELQPGDALSSFAGVRSVISSGAADPSKESREHAIWRENGLLTVTGGKLTTFRLMARETLVRAAGHTQESFVLPSDGTQFEAADAENPVPGQLDRAGWQRLQARFGPLAQEVALCGQEGEFERIAGLPSRWVEIRWAAREESTQHLEDLILRRTRIGLQLPHGGVDYLPRIRAIAQAELGWSDERWLAEQSSYRSIWSQYYSP